MRALRAMAVALLLVVGGCAGSPLSDARSGGHAGGSSSIPTPAEALQRPTRGETTPEQSPTPLPDDPPGELRITFLDVGQGQATLLQASDATVLVDAGRHDRSDVVPALTRLGVQRLDVVAISHPHADHVGQLAEILAAFPVEEVWMSGTHTTTATFSNALDALAASPAGYEEPRAEARTMVGSFVVDVLGPRDPLTGNVHADSLMLRVTYGDVAVLLTGDAEDDIEAQLVASSPETLKASVYQVAHHGSATSSSAAFLRAVAPQVAVYSAGAGNDYGHPDAGVLRRLVDIGAAIYGTDVHGDVTVTTDGRSVKVSTASDGSAMPAPSAPVGPLPAPVPAPAVPPAAAPNATTASSCDQNYGGACVPVYPPDVNCGSLDASDIAVIGRDVHHLDGNDDGVACES